MRQQRWLISTGSPSLRQSAPGRLSAVIEFVRLLLAVKREYVGTLVALQAGCAFSRRKLRSGMLLGQSLRP
jgi:hypothetical protein